MAIDGIGKKAPQVDRSQSAGTAGPTSRTQPSTPTWAPAPSSVPALAKRTDAYALSTAPTKVETRSVQLPGLTAPPAAAELFGKGSSITDPSTSKAVSAAAAEVHVTDQGLIEERDAVLDENTSLQKELAADVKQWQAELPSLEKDKTCRVEKQRDGFTVTRLDAKGNPEAVVKLEQKAGETKLTELTRQGDDWVGTLRTDSRKPNGDGELRVRTGEFEGYGAKLPDMDGLRPDKAQRGHDLHITNDSGKVVREEQQDLREADGRQIQTETSKVEIELIAKGKLKLPGEIEKAFDPDHPVIRRKASFSVDVPLRAKKTTFSEITWAQDQVRASQVPYQGQSAIQLEKEVDPGRRKEAQLFVPGTQQTVRTTTTADGKGSVHEEQVLWDSQNDHVGAADAKAKVLRNEITDRRYGADGQLDSQEQVSQDRVKDTSEKTGYQRTVDGDISTESSTVERRVKDKIETSSAVRQNRLTPEGPVLSGLDVRQGDRELSLSIDHGGITYDVSEKNKPVSHGVLSTDATGGPMMLKVNGKSIVLPSDPSQGAKLLNDTFSKGSLTGLDVVLREASRAQVFAASVQKTKGVDTVKDRVQWGMAIADKFHLAQDAFNYVSDQVGRAESVIAGVPEKPVVAETGNVPGVFSQLSNAVDFISIGDDAVTALNQIRQGEYLRGGLRGARAVSQAVQTGSRAAGYLGTATFWGRRMRAGRAGLDIAQGAYDTAKGDTSFDRMKGVASMASGGLRVGLALTASSGPLAPALFGGMMVVATVRFAADIADKRYVAPLAEGLAHQG